MIEQTRTDHVNKSYKMADGGVVPRAGTIGAFPSAIMPTGAPVDEPEPPPEKASPAAPQNPQAFQERPDNSMQWGSHR